MQQARLDRRSGSAVTDRSRTRALAPGIFMAVIAALLVPISAYAVSGYPPGPFPGAAPAGAFPTVLTSQSVGPGGGTISVADGAASLVLVVPANAFAVPTQITIYGDSATVLAPLLPAGKHLVVAYAVGWTPTTTAAAALTLTISDAAISSGDTAYETTPAGLTAAPSATIGTGNVVWTFTADPGLVVGQTGPNPTPPATDTGTAGVTTQAAAGNSSVIVALVAVAFVLAIGVGLYLRRRHRPSVR